MKKNKKTIGFTLLEIVVTLGVLVLSVVGIARLMKAYLRITANEKFKVTAATLANHKLETIRNLPYKDIGTVGGIPPGNLPAEETITRNGVKYTVKTTIVYIDDPFDGTITTTENNNSIYRSTNNEVVYYWGMENNTNGQSPDIGSGTINFEGTQIVTGYKNNGIQLETNDRITASCQDININEGRIGIWFKPNTSNPSNSYFVKCLTTDDYFYFRINSEQRLQLTVGDEDAESSPLTWEVNQWYFLEAAWKDDANYIEVWRNGAPLDMEGDNFTPPTLDPSNTMWIGSSENSSEQAKGVIDELYILNNAHPYEIWGYSSNTNPYYPTNPDVTYYWNMDDNTSPQNPQIGSGSITLGGTINKVRGVKNDALEVTGYYDYNYISLPVAGNLNTEKGRLSFWYQPTKTDYDEDRVFFNAYNCNGSFRLSFPKTISSSKIRLEYGKPPNNIIIDSDKLDWDKDWWYLIEFAYDATSDKAEIFVNRQKVISSTSVTLDAPTGCQTLYLGNDSSTNYNLLRGQLDELFILSEPYPESSQQDLLNTDYKRIKVTVEWETPWGKESLYSMTDVAPPGIETNEGGGTLKVKVFDSNGLAVSQANVNITNASVTPAIDLNLTTNDDGEIILPGTPTSTEYMITVTKSGYSTDRTYQATSTNSHPVRPPVTVLEGQLTEVSFSIDLVSTLTVNTYTQSSLPISWQINKSATTSAQVNANVASDGTYFYFVWEDKREGAYPRIYAQKNDLGGNYQWTDDTRIVNAQNQLHPRLVLDGSSNIYITWYDNSVGNKEVYLAKYDSLGNKLWGGQRVNSDYTNADQLLSDLALVGNEILVVWQDKRNDNGDIYFNKFNTSGDKLLVNDIKINKDTGTAEQKNPKIIADSNNNIYVAWLDDRNNSGQFDIYINKIDTNGNTLWTNEQRIDNNEGSGIPSITDFDLAINSLGNAYLTWADNRNSKFDIWWQGIATTSVLLFTQDKALNTQASSSQQISPRIAIDNSDNLFIAWEDNRRGNNDVYAMKLDNLGNNLWPQEVQMNNLTDSDQYINDLIVYQGNKIIVTWTDYTWSVGNIYASTIDYDGNRSAVPNVDFILRGSKKIYENPDKLKFEQSFTTDLNGTITITGLEWDTYNIEIAEPGYSLAQSDPALPLSLPANSSQTINLIIQ